MHFENLSTPNQTPWKDTEKRRVTMQTTNEIRIESNAATVKTLTATQQAEIRKANGTVYAVRNAAGDTIGYRVYIPFGGTAKGKQEKKQWELTDDETAAAITIMEMAACSYWTKLRYRANNNHVGYLQLLQNADRDDVVSMSTLAMWHEYKEGERDTHTVYTAGLKAMGKWWNDNRHATVEYNPDSKRVNPEPRTAEPIPTSENDIAIVRKAITAAVDGGTLDDIAIEILWAWLDGYRPNAIKAGKLNPTEYPLLDGVGISDGKYKVRRQKILAAIIANLPPHGMETVTHAAIVEKLKTLADRQNKRKAATKAADRKRNADPIRKAAKAAAARERRKAAKAAAAK
jgi:hypothetical protein